MKHKLKILLLEDLPTDAELILRQIRKSGIDFISQVVEIEEEYIKALETFKPDIILSDYSLPFFNGMKALSIRKGMAPLIPFILVTGSINEETAVEVMKAGADDYLIKEHLTRIGAAIQAALDRSKINLLRIQAEEKLAWEQFLFKTLIENIPDKIYFKDLESRFIRVNKALSDSFHLDDPLKAMGRSDKDFFESEHATEAYEDEQEIIRTGKPIVGKEEMEIWPDRSITWASTTKMPLCDNKGQIIGTFGISRDITEHKKIEQELFKSKEKAEENDKLKSAFLHNISHEIRTPMNAIIGFSKFLSNPDLPHDKRIDFANIVIQSSNQLLAIITDIVRISTIEAGQEAITEHQINLNTICRLVYEQFLPSAQCQQVSLNYTTPLDNNDANIVTDHSKLLQILTNLVGNAMKFTREGGSVKFGYSIEGNKLEFFTKDTGIGIAPEMHSEIFKRFRQLDYSATRKFGGSGLGLSISKAYVELMGGKMWLTSEPGEGSAFYFTLPWKTNKPVENQANEISKEKERMFNVLIAEDDESNFQVLEEILKALKFNIIRAFNGLQAVDICNSTEIDMVLMDLKMPELDGYEATRRIKELHPQLPVIAQTAYALPDEKEKAYTAGCDDYLSKPISDKEISRVLKRFLG